MTEDSHVKHSFFDRSNTSKVNKLIFIVFEAALFFFLTVLAVRYYRQNYRPTKPKYNFLNFQINAFNPRMKLYSGRINFDSIATDYYSKGMPDLLKRKVWDNLDSASIPIINYSFGKHYNPVTTSQSARALHWRMVQNDNVVDRKLFLNNIAWLMKNHHNYYFQYEFVYRHASIPVIPKGWISAMAQGEALGALSVAFHATGDAKYRDAAKEVFRTLHINRDSLWCFGVDNAGYYWLEEYPSESFCHVLNGMLYALWGIWDYYVITRDQLALTLFRAGIRTIADNYPSWKSKTQRLSYYCWHRHSNADYHQLHLFQLQVFSDFFNIPEFREAQAYFSRIDTLSGS